MLLFLLIAVGNFALGFALAIQFGHGPSWIDANAIDLAHPGRMMNSLRATLRGRKR